MSGLVTSKSSESSELGTLRLLPSSMSSALRGHLFRIVIQVLFSSASGSIADSVGCLQCSLIGEGVVATATGEEVLHRISGVEFRVRNTVLPATPRPDQVATRADRGETARDPKLTVDELNQTGSVSGRDGPTSSPRIHSIISDLSLMFSLPCKPASRSSPGNSVSHRTRTDSVARVIPV